jgi:hypothetical protein
LKACLEEKKGVEVGKVEHEVDEASEAEGEMEVALADVASKALAEVEMIFAAGAAVVARAVVALAVVVHEDAALAVVVHEDAALAGVHVAFAHIWHAPLAFSLKEMPQFLFSVGA